MKKAEALAHWRLLAANRNPLEHMTPIGYKASGSRYGACGIRSDGNPEFVDAVLSCLKPLLDGENQVTRLELARNDVAPVEINGERKTFHNADRAAQVCYIRLHLRGHEGVIASAFFDTHLKGATDRFAQTNAYAR